MSVRILRIREVTAKTGLSRAGVYAGMAAQSFPRSINITDYTVGWIEAEIDEWLLDRIKASRKRQKKIAAEAA